MKKTTVKKLVLAKETVRRLTDDLRRVRGADDDASMFSCIMVSCVESYCQVCDAQETAHPTCMA